jgi:hypothetical protein
LSPLAIDPEEAYLYKEGGEIVSQKFLRFEEAAVRRVVYVSKNAIPQIPPLLTISQNPPKFL